MFITIVLVGAEIEHEENEAGTFTEFGEGFVGSLRLIRWKLHRELSPISVKATLFS